MLNIMEIFVIKKHYTKEQSLGKFRERSSFSFLDLYYKIQAKIPYVFFDTLVDICK